MKESGNPDFAAARQSLANVGTNRRSGSNPRASNIAGLGDMKALMKKQLDNAQVYEEGNRVSTGGIGSGRQSSNKRQTVAQV